MRLRCLGAGHLEDVAQLRGVGSDQGDVQHPSCDRLLRGVQVVVHFTKVSSLSVRAPPACELLSEPLSISLVVRILAVSFLLSDSLTI